MECSNELFHNRYDTAFMCDWLQIINMSTHSDVCLQTDPQKSISQKEIYITLT